MNLNYPGLLGYALLLGGQELVARRWRFGWLLRILGDLVWVVLGFLTGLWSISVASGLFCLIDVRAWFRQAEGVAGKKPAGVL